MTTRILIVDEFPLLRAGLLATLEQEPGLLVDAVTGSASEALASVRAQALDLAIVGLGFGGSGGLELVGRLRDEAPGMPVLAYALVDERVYAERALRAGARGFIGRRYG
jgi:DNA-binding NarL/FixJ family response regulator